MEEKYDHIMIDIETMGSSSNSAIVSIAAVEFSLDTGIINNIFICRVDLQSCLDIGLSMSASTVEWWMSQSHEARHDFINGEKVSITIALQMLSEFIIKCGGSRCKIWGNSPRFDLGIISDAYNKLNLPIPWDFRKERCVRTLVSFKPELKTQELSGKSERHTALGDCYLQIKYCHDVWSHLQNK